MKIKLIILLLIALILTSCSRAVVTEEDEIRLKSWHTKLENSSEVSLSFEGDNAEFEVKSEDSDACVVLSGLCVFDNERFMLYNKDESEPYFFEYKLKEGTLTLEYDGGKVTLKN